MTIISLARLELALDHLALTETHLVESCPQIEMLLARQRRLDRLQPLADLDSMIETPLGSGAHQKTWFAGKSHLEHRLFSLGAVQSRQTEQFLLTASQGHQSTVARLVVLFSTLEPGVTSEAVLRVAADLATQS